jgi:hypothetical protein
MDYKVINPLTNCEITIGSRSYKHLLKLYDYNAEKNVLSRKQDIVINPLTNCKIKIGGKTYKQLIKSNIYTYNDKKKTFDLISGHDDINIKDKFNKKIINPLNNQKIKIGSKIFKSLLWSYTFNKFKNKLELKNNLEKCPICFENSSNKKMPCGHICCYLCFCKIIKSCGDKCPMCRHSLIDDLDFQNELLKLTRQIMETYYHGNNFDLV